METQTINNNQNILNSEKMNDFETILKELEELDDNDLFYEANKTLKITKH